MFFIFKIYLSCPISLARTSSVVLNINAKNGYLHFSVSNLGKNAFSFSLLSEILVVGLSCMAFIILKHIPFLTSLLRVFIMTVVGLCKMFFLNLLRKSHDFYFHSFNVISSLIKICWPIAISPSWSWHSPSVLWMWFSSILLRIFASIIISDIGL